MLTEDQVHFVQAEINVQNQGNKGGFFKIVLQYWHFLTYIL